MRKPYLFTKNKQGNVLFFRRKVHMMKAALMASVVTTFKGRLPDFALENMQSYASLNEYEMAFCTLSIGLNECEVTLTRDEWQTIHQLGTLLNYKEQDASWEETLKKRVQLGPHDAPFEQNEPRKNE